MPKDEANTLTQSIWMEGERSGWIMPARWSSARPPVRAGELRPAAAGSGADELCPTAASMCAEEFRHVRRERRQAPLGVRLAGASVLRGSFALAAMGARGGHLRPGRRRCRQRQAWLGRRYARGSSGRPPWSRVQASSARRHARAHRARCHRGTSTSDAGDGVASFGPQLTHLNRFCT